MDNLLEFDLNTDHDEIEVKIRIDASSSGDYDWGYRDEYGVFAITFTKKPVVDA